MQTYVRRSVLGGAVVAVEGSFHEEDAEQLQSMAWALKDAGPVTLDFDHVRSASDCALARLARSLLRVSLPVSMVGLSIHQHRLLQYIALEPAPSH